MIGAVEIVADTSRARASLHPSRPLRDCPYPMKNTLIPALAVSVWLTTGFAQPAA